MALNDLATLVGDVDTCLGSSQRMVSSVVDFVSPISNHGVVTCKLGLTDPYVYLLNVRLLGFC